MFTYLNVGTTNDETYLFDVLRVRRPLDLGEQRCDVHGHHGGSGKTRDGDVGGHHRVRGHQHREEWVNGVRVTAAVQDSRGGRGHRGRGQHGRGGLGVQRRGGGLRKRVRAGKSHPCHAYGHQRRSLGGLGLQWKKQKKNKITNG